MNKFLTLILFIAATFTVNAQQCETVLTAPATVAGTADGSSASFSFSGVATGTVIELVAVADNTEFTVEMCGTNPDGWADGTNDSRLTIVDINGAGATSLGTIEDGCTNGAGPEFWGPSNGSWVAATAGTYYMLLTEWNAAGTDGCIADGANSSYMIDIAVSGFVAGTCEAGTYSGANPLEVCPSTLGVFEVGTAMADGGFVMGFSDAQGGTGGLAGGFSITGITTAPYSFDSDLNGVLSTNSLPLLDGTWELTFYALDAGGNPCDSTAVIPVNFNTTETPCMTPVEDIKELSSLDITPNPSNGVFSMNLGLNSAQEVSVQIIDVAGKVITSQQQIGSTVQFDFDLSNLSIGMYFAKISIDGETTTEKIMINN